MKKKNILAFFIVILLAGIWIYFANQFEKTVVNNILPALEQQKSIIHYNSMEINKYKFNVTFKEVKIFPESKILSFYSDKIVVRKIPFKKSIDLASNGEKEGKIVHPENVLYAPEHKIYIRATRVGPSLEAYNLDIKVDKMKLIESQTNNKLATLDNYKISYIWKKQNEDNHINLETKGNVISTSYYIDFIITKVMKKFGVSEARINEYIQHYDSSYNSQMDNILKSEDNIIAENIKYQFIYKDTLREDIISYIKQPDEMKIALLVKSLLDTDYSLNISYNDSSKIDNSTLSINIINNENFKFNIGMDIGLNLTSEQKEKLLDLVVAETYNSYSKALKKQESVNNDNLKKEDFKRVIQPFVDMEKLNCKIELDFYKSAKSLDFLINLGLNKHNIEYKGNYKDLKIDSELKIADYYNFINSITIYTEEALLPYINGFLNRSITRDEFKQTLKTFKEDLLQITEIINKNGPLREGETLVTPLEVDIKSSEVKINNKNKEELLNNEKINQLIENLKINFLSESSSQNNPPSK